jgi:chromosomal replication initiation ATPase DnaA
VDGRVSEILEPERLLDMLGGRAGYRRFVLEGLKDGHREDYYQVEDQRFLGGEKFAQKLKRKVNEEETPRRKQQLSVVFRTAARAVGVEAQVLEGADRGWRVSQSRALVGYVLIRQLGYKLKDVAKYLGRDIATVSSLVSRLDVRMNENETLRRRVAGLTADCLE